MTTNGAIALINTIIAAVFIALGLSLVWQARRSLGTWPVSALVALAGPYLLGGLVFGQLVLLRTTDLPGVAFDRDGLGTLALRIITAAVASALLQRIVRGRLLTTVDRARVEGRRG